MRILSIATKHGDKRLINPNQITQIWADTGALVDSQEIIINLACGSRIRTQFTTIDHALDYIQRASSHSLVGG